MEENMNTQLTEEQIQQAVTAYPNAVTGPYSGCQHPEAVLRYALAQGGDCADLARNYALSLHGACWNGMCGKLEANGWLRWFAGAR